jgi:hypothetical protein
VHCGHPAKFTQIVEPDILGEIKRWDREAGREKVEDGFGGLVCSVARDVSGNSNVAASLDTQLIKGYWSCRGVNKIRRWQIEGPKRRIEGNVEVFKESFGPIKGG